MNTSNMPLIILTGPTAVGKTRLSVELAKRIGGEIISADSILFSMAVSCLALSAITKSILFIV